ncbi:MAG: 50S ribosomal protein L11 methyltransferase [Myxococcales bacterium]|nr:50S ribosomal protein L11 methyltransferase [Myxococcales bacterium]
METTAPPRWIRVRLRSEPGGAEDLTGLLAELGALGAEITSTGVTAYFSDADGPDRIRALLRSEPDLGADARGLVLDWLEAEPWHEACKTYFRPQTVAGRLWVGAPWHEGPEGALQAIRINPGAAFGTGTHETTRLCLEFLAETSLAGKRVLDVGTGSGILAIAVRALGAGSVVAVDVDPIAIESAAENRALNDDVGPIDLRIAGAGDVEGSFDLVLANLIEGVLLAERDAILARVAPGGALVLSGLLVDQAEGVARAYGLDVLEIRVQGAWAAALLRRR